MALPEIIIATSAIQNLILSGESSEAIVTQAKKENFKSLKEWGEILIADRRTSRTEVERVTS
jgi:type II secretory ATPase GspE/PulE/Tfp pilus assembly ATPase PilB-like protein